MLGVLIGMINKGEHLTQRRALEGTGRKGMGFQRYLDGCTA